MKDTATNHIMTNIAKYPTPKDVDGIFYEDALEAFDLVNKVCHGMRSLKQDYQLTQKKNIQFYVTAEKHIRAKLDDLVSDMQVLGTGKVDVLDDPKAKPAVSASCAS